MITCEGIISYPAIWEPKENLSGVMKYSCSPLIDKADKAGIKGLNDAIDRAVIKGKSEKWNNKLPKFRYTPLRDGDAELESGEKTDPIYKGKVFLNCSSDTAPQVVGPDAQPLMDQNALYAGCIVRLDVNPFPYKHAGSAGIGWGLNNVMLVRDGSRLDGRANATEAFSSFAETASGLEDDLM
jgi:hypothetical protein